LFVLRLFFGVKFLLLFKSVCIAVHADYLAGFVFKMSSALSTSLNSVHVTHGRTKHRTDRSC